MIEPGRTLGSLLLFAACAHAGSINYAVSVIPPPAGWSDIGMYGINDSGQVAGYGQYPLYQAFIGTTFGQHGDPSAFRCRQCQFGLWFY